MPVPNPRQSIYALRGWIDRIEQDARADAAKKYGTLDEVKPATPPEAANPWGAGEVSIRLTPEHGCISGPPTRGSVVTPSPTEAPRPSAPEAARAPLRSERAPQRECERAPLRSERSPAEERRAPQRECATRDSDDAVAAAHARAQRYEAERRAEPACARRPELRECAPRPDKPTNLRASAPAGGAPGSLDEARRLLKAWSFVEEEAQRRRARALRRSPSPEAPVQRRRAPKPRYSDPEPEPRPRARRPPEPRSPPAVARWGGPPPRSPPPPLRREARHATMGRPPQRARAPPPPRAPALRVGRTPSPAPPPPPPRRRRPAAPPVAVPARPRIDMKDRHLRAAERRRADALVQRERAEAKRLQRAAEAERRRNEAEAAERRDNQQRLREARQQKQAALDALERERDRRRRDAVERKRRAVEDKRRHEARERAALEQQRRGMILAKRFRADRVAILLARIVRVWGSYACSTAHRRRQADRRGRRLRERFLRAAPFRRWAAFTRNARRERHAFAQERLLTKPFRAWAAWVASKRMVLMRLATLYEFGGLSKAWKVWARATVVLRRRSEYDRLQSQLRRDRVNEAKAERHDERRLAAKAWRAWVVGMAGASSLAKVQRRQKVEAQTRGRRVAAGAAPAGVARPAPQPRTGGAQAAPPPPPASQRRAAPNRVAPTLDERHKQRQETRRALAERTNARLAERRQREEAARAARTVTHQAAYEEHERLKREEKQAEEQRKELMRQQYRVARLHYNRALLVWRLKAWVTFVEMSRSDWTKARKWCDDGLAQKTWMAWTRWRVLRREATLKRQQKILAHAARVAEKAAVRRPFATWVARTNDVLSRAADVVSLKRRKTLQGRLVAWRLKAAREKLRWQHADVRADRIYNRTMLVKLVRNWRVAVDAFKRDAAIEARVAAKRAEVRGWLAGGDLGASLDGSLSESLKFLT